MALWTGAWLAGVALQLQQVTLWTAAQQAALAAVALALLLLAWQRPPARTLLGALGLALLALASTDWRAAQRLAEQLPAALEGQDIQVTGVVARLPQSNLAGTRFVLRVEQAQHQGRPVQLPTSLALGWYRGPDVDALLRGPDDLRAGQRWRFTVRLRQPHGQLNPLGFDHELWLWEQGLRATGYVRSRAGDEAQKLADDAGHPVERLRQRVRDRIQAQVDDAGAAGCWRRWPSATRGRSTAATGTCSGPPGVAHLMSISGLHVTMFAWLAGRAGRPRLAWVHPRHAVDARAHRGALGRAAAGPAYARAGGLGRAGAAHGADDRHPGAAAQPGSALATDAGAAGGRGGGDAAGPLGPAAAGLLAVVRGRGPADAVRPRAGRRAAGRPKPGLARWRRCWPLACAPRPWPPWA
jgi:hypothetical protein